MKSYYNRWGREQRLANRGHMVRCSSSGRHHVLSSYEKEKLALRLEHLSYRFWRRLSDPTTSLEEVQDLVREVFRYGSQMGLGEPSDLSRILRGKAIEHRTRNPELARRYRWAIEEAQLLMGGVQ